jgi:nucleoid DNA-binding protein
MKKKQKKFPYAKMVRNISMITGITQPIVNQVLRTFMDEVMIQLKKGLSVSLPHFGKFKIAKWRDRRRVGFSAYRKNSLVQTKTEE